jgi:tetratricopeptide (TPR) repeat protein
VEFPSSDRTKSSELVQELTALETALSSGNAEVRTALRMRYMATMRLVVRECLEQGCGAQAESKALHALTLFPDEEEAHEALISCYVQSGRVAEAIHHLETQHSLTASGQFASLTTPLTPIAPSNKWPRRMSRAAILLVMLGTGAGITTVVRQRAPSPASVKINRQVAPALLSPERVLELELTAYNDRAEYREAQRLCDVALAQYRQAGNQAGVADSLARKGQAVEAQGDNVQARQFYQAAISIRKQRNEPLAVAHLLEMLSGLSQSEGAYKEADAMLQQSQDLRQQGNDVVGVALCLRDRGQLAAEQCQYNTAATDYRECLRLIVPCNKPDIAAHVQALQGMMARDQGDFQRARRLLTSSLVFWQARNHSRWVAGMKRALAVTAYYERNDAKARQYFEESLQGYERVGDHAGTVETQLGLARVLAHLGQLKEASLLLHAVQAASQEPKSPLFLARTWEAEAEILAHSEHGQAESLLTRAQAQRQKLNCPLPPVEQSRMQLLRKLLP